MSQTSNNRIISVYDLCCCVLPQCECLHAYSAGSPITTVFSTDIGSLNCNWLT